MSREVIKRSLDIRLDCSQPFIFSYCYGYRSLNARNCERTGRQCKTRLPNPTPSPSTYACLALASFAFSFACVNREAVNSLTSDKNIGFTLASYKKIKNELSLKQTLCLPHIHQKHCPTNGCTAQVQNG